MRRSVFVQPIAKPPEVIWAFVADLRNDKLWRREVMDVRLVSGTPPGAPADYELTVEWEGLRSKLILHVPESVKGRRVVIETDSESDYYSRSVWTIEPQGPNSLVTLSFSFEARGVLQIAEPFIWPTVSGWLERDLPLLEGHLSAA